MSDKEYVLLRRVILDEADYQAESCHDLSCASDQIAASIAGANLLKIYAKIVAGTTPYVG